MTSKGRRLTHLTIALGAFVLLIAGYASRDLAVEQWYIWDLESEEEETRKVAAEKLGDMGCLRAIPSLLRQIKQSEAKNSSMFSYRVSGPPRSFYEQRDIHKHYEKRYRDQAWGKNWAGRALAEIGISAIPAMITSLKFDRHLTGWVEEVFVRMGPEALPVLLEAMESPEWRVRARTAEVLGSFEPSSESVVQSLRKALHDQHDHVRVFAMQSLGEIGPGAKESVPELVEVVLTNDGLIQNIGIRTLGRIGPDAEAAVQALTNLLQDEDEQVRLAAARALETIQGESATAFR